MRVEQACRFRLDEGYCIFAKSAGLQPAQEIALGDAFNSTMNTIFPKLGASILSCTPGKNDAFLARNTLRTDVLGRKTIFTHAYILSAEEYTRCMEENPEILLSVPMEQMLDAQTPEAQMSQLELQMPEEGQWSLEALFEKYNLTPERYGRLLMGAYEAMTSNASLRLKTNLPLERTEQLVKEMTYCILDGLLPVLKGKVSFSSGADTRMKISVIPAGDTAIQSSDIVFGVEEDRYTNIRPKDEVSALAFRALGSASHTERRQVLEKMQYWLNEVTNVQEGLSVMLVSAAYCMSSGRELSQDMSLMLFRSITSAGKGFSNLVINGLLTGLVKQMNAQGSCSSQALSLIAGWYLKDSSAGYREEADLTFATAPVDICAALVQAVFLQTMTDNVRQLLRVLLKRIPPESGALPEDVQDQVILWILAENVEEFSQYATILMSIYGKDQMVRLAQGVLAGASGRKLTASEDIVLAKALRTLTEAGVCLREDECAQLDSFSLYYSDELMNSALAYLFAVRLAGKTPEEGLKLLEVLAVQQPKYFAVIYDEMAGGTRNCALLWEHYQTKHCLRSGMNALELEQTCKTVNTFQNPGGLFEMRAAALWMALVEEDFSLYTESAQLQYYVTVLIQRWAKDTLRLAISDKTKTWICNEIVKCFWKTIPFEKIFTNEFQLPEFMHRVPAEGKQKYEVLNLCLGIHQEPTNTQRFIDLVCSETTDAAYRKELTYCARRLVGILLKKQAYLSWDLTLLSFWVQTEEGGTVDVNKLTAYCNALDQYFGKHNKKFRIEAEDSLLLKDEKLVKTICKLGNDVPGVLGQLIEQLKSRKKGLLQNLFGSGSSEKKPGFFASDEQSPKRGGRFAENSRRDKGRAFDPTDVGFVDDDDWRNKKGNNRR